MTIMNRKDIVVVYLWAEVIGYVHGVLRYIAAQVKSVDVIHWDKREINSTQYSIINDNSISFHHRSALDHKNIYDLLVAKKPNIIVVSAWMDDAYIKACKRYKLYNSSVIVVAGIDDQWIGSLRQQIGRFYYALFYKKLFDFMWVSGPPQFSFAQRFGYQIHSILPNLYSADTDLFTEPASFSKRFLYVGRFVKRKAPDLLLRAYIKLPIDIQKEWPLIFIGDGELKEKIVSIANPNIHVKPFLQPNDLRHELLKGGIACMPSYKDQWGVAVHEYALLGLPMLLSSGVGAVTQFLIPGYNGYLFQKNNAESLYKVLVQYTDMADSDLITFGINSRKLGERISNEISANSLLSCLDITSARI